MLFIFLSLTSFCITISWSIHVAANAVWCFFLWLHNIRVCVCVCGCLHVLAVVKQCCNVHWDACTFLSYSLLWIYAQEQYHFTQIRMAIIKNLQTIRAGEGVEKWEPSYTVGLECKFQQPLWKTIWRFLKKQTKTRFSIYDPEIPLLGIYPEKMKTLI